MGGDGQGSRPRGPCGPQEELKEHFKGQAKPVETGPGSMGAGNHQEAGMAGGKGSKGGRRAGLQKTQGHEALEGLWLSPCVGGAPRGRWRAAAWREDRFAAAEASSRGDSSEGGHGRRGERRKLRVVGLAGGAY